MIRLCLVLISLFGAFHCLPAVAQSLGGPLVSEQVAQRYGLTRSWFGHVDLDRTRDRIQSVTLHDGVLVAQTKRGVVHAMDAETGKTLWVQRVGSGMHPTTEVGVSDKHVSLLNGSNLYMLSRKDGSIIWQRRVVGAPGAGPALGGEHVFVPTISGVLEAYEIENPRKPAWMYNAGGRALVQPVVSLSSVGWPTDRGYFYVAGVDNLNIRFRTEAQDDIVAPPAYIPPYYYVASLDGYLYKVHERSGKISWRFSAGEPVVARPVAVDGRIYITAQHGGLYCVLGDAEVASELAAAARREAEDRGEEVPDEPAELPVEESGELWWTPGIVRLLAVTPTRVYGLDKVGRMVIVRGDTGSPIDSVAAQNISMSVINHTTDRIYMGTDTGLIQCLHETELKEPLKYVMLEKLKKTRGEVKQRGLAEGDADAKKDDADPFAGDADDPFAIGGEDDPFGGAGDAGGDDDPFGGGDAGGDDAGGNDDPFGGGGDAGGDDDPFGGGGDDPFG